MKKPAVNFEFFFYFGIKATSLYIALVIRNLLFSLERGGQFYIIFTANGGRQNLLNWVIGA